MPKKKNKINLKKSNIYSGDCLEHLKNISSNSIDLIYLDPPFFSQKNHQLKNKSGTKQYNFTDKWVDIDEYINYIGERLIESRRVLKETGSLFLHCDNSASHYLKIKLDQIFGSNNFQSEIIWSYRRWSNAKKGLLNNHQIIFFYSKSSHFKFNKIYENYSPTTNVEQIVQLRKRDSRNKSIYKLDQNGKPELASSKKGVPLGDVWEIPFLNPKAKERVNYPTQKPILLLEKIIKLVTDEGDIVLDPFCGSGSTLVAAQLLKRQFVGIDLNNSAVKLSHKRLQEPIKTESKLLKNGKQSYLKQAQETSRLIQKINAVIVHRNKGIDGLFSNNENIIPVKVVNHNNNIEKDAELLIRSSRKNNYKFKALYVNKTIQQDIVKKIENTYKIIIFKNKKELLRKIKNIK